MTMSGFSQLKVHVGASTAINSTFVLDKGLNKDLGYTRVASFDMAPIGFTFGTDFSPKFGLQLEGIVTKYNQIYDIKEKVAQAQATAENIGQLKFDMSYLSIPMMLKFMGGSDNKARMNFAFGPQLSLLTSGSEQLVLEQIAEGKDIAIPDIADPENIDSYISGATLNEDGTFALPESINPEDFSTDLLKKNAEEKLSSFKNQEFHLVGGMGLDVDVSKNLYISINLKADYSFTDMRNGDLIEQLEAGSLKDIFGNRANLAVGAQITVNYMFGGTRSFLAAGL